MTKSVNMSEEDAQCPSCGRTDFKSERGMKTHHTAQHNESLSVESVECENCGKEFESQKTHNRKYCSQDCQHKSLRGEFSGERFKGKGLHSTKNDSSNKENGKKCPHCGQGGFKNEHGLKIHHTKYHGESLVEEPDYADVECPTCGREDFQTLGGMRNHHTMKHDESIAYEMVVCQGCNSKFKSRKSHERSYCKQCHDEGAYITEETKRKMSKAKQGENHWAYGLKGEEHPCYNKTLSDERKQALSKANSGKGNGMYGKTSKSEIATVAETGHTVRSSWEKEIDLMLYNNDIDFGYEDERFEFESVEMTYLPDFIIDEQIIEVKGWADDRSVERAKQFIKEYSQYQYIVVGDEMPCDVHIEWDNREKLMGVLNEQ